MLNGLARALARRGVHANRAGPATLTFADSRFTLTVDARAALEPGGTGRPDGWSCH